MPLSLCANTFASPDSLSFGYRFYMHQYFLSFTEIAAGLHKRHNKCLCAVCGQTHARPLSHLIY